MQRVETLREQASILRKLAESFDMPEMKQDLLHLADRCELLAARAAREISEQLRQPISALKVGAGDS